MAKHWFEEAFGKALGDIHHELIQRGVYQRNDRIGDNFGSQPTRQQPDLGWTLPDRDKGNAPDLQPHEPAKAERGIDR